MPGFSDSELLSEWKNLVSSLGPQYQGELQCFGHSLTYVDPNGLKLEIDFFNNRELYGRIPVGKNELLAKAIGLKNSISRVLDATAGLGSDSLFLARMGLEVLAIERNPVVFFLLHYSQQRALNFGPQNKKDSETISALKKVQFIHGDLIKQTPVEVAEFKPEVAYVDPMYPHTNKTALPRKEMVVFRSFIGPDNDADNLLLRCKSLVQNRVVVKRPLKGEFLGEKPDHSFTGKTVRYDMYLVK